MSSYFELLELLKQLVFLNPYDINIITTEVKKYKSKNNLR